MSSNSSPPVTLQGEKKKRQQSEESSAAGREGARSPTTTVADDDGVGTNGRGAPAGVPVRTGGVRVNCVSWLRRVTFAPWNRAQQCFDTHKSLGLYSYSDNPIVLYLKSKSCRNQTSLLYARSGFLNGGVQRSLGGRWDFSTFSAVISTILT